MTTLTMEPTAAALANKKQFGKAVLAKANSLPTWMTGAWARVTGPFKTIVKALKLDAAASAAGGLFRTAWDKATGAVRWVGDLLGWRNLGIYALTDPEVRHQLIDLTLAGAKKVSRFFSAIAVGLGKIPVVGGWLRRGLDETRCFIGRWSGKGLVTAEVGIQAVEANEIGGLVMSLANTGATLDMGRRVITRFLPASFHRPLVIISAVLLAGRIGQFVYAKWAARTVNEEMVDLTEAAEALKEAEASGDTVAVVKIPADATPAQKAAAIAEAAKHAEATRKKAQPKAAAR